MKENKLIHNAKWIIACKVVQSLLQLLVGMLCARYLGPSNYGLINYAKSVVAIVIPLMQLGLNETLVQELINAPKKNGEILGTALLMNLLSGVFCMLLVCGFVQAANPDEPLTMAICGLYSLSLLFQALEGVQYWFHSRLKSKYPSIMRLLAYVCVSAYKMYLLAAQKHVLWFAVVSSVEYGVIGIGLLLIYHHLDAPRLAVSLQTARKLLAKSKFYIVSSFMVMAFQNTAPITLKLLGGEAENGYYAAAVTCAAVVQFVYMAIIDSARPVILESKKTDQKQFEKNVSRLYCITTYLSLAQSVVFCIFAQWIIRILYGADYLASVPVLQIMIWQTAFSYMGSVRNIWILAEEKHSRLWTINLWGALTNILLNLCMVPAWGACGAAAASVATQIVTNFAVGFLMKDIRPNNQLLLAGLDPRLAWNILREFVQKR